jgi:hypothetical protein
LYYAVYQVEQISMENDSDIFTEKNDMSLCLLVVILYGIYSFMLELN